MLCGKINLTKIIRLASFSIRNERRKRLIFDYKVIAMIQHANLINSY